MIFKFIYTIVLNSKHKQLNRQEKIMNPVTVLRNIEQELIRTYNLPFTVTICVKLLSTIHKVWWFSRKRQLLKPEHIIPTAFGAALQAGLKLGPNILENCVQGIAKIILIATRIDECLKRMQSLERAFNHLKDTATFKYAPFKEPEWIKSPDAIVFSAHATNQWKSGTKECIAYIGRMFHCLRRVFSHIFKLNMQLWDTYNAFVFSHEAIPELFVNGIYWYRKLGRDKEYMITKLEEYEPLIQTIFDATHSQISAETFIDRTKVILEGFDKVDKHVHVLRKKVIKRGKKLLGFLVA